MARAPVYLDYHATTPVDERVLEAMLPYFTRDFGNAASSTHSWGWRARDAVEAARRDVAALIGAQPREIVFTGGATESNNMAIHGVTMTAPSARRHIVVSAIEHKSVIEPAQHLTARGWRVTIAPVQRDGRIDLDALAGTIGDDTALVSVMAANNEIGVLQPLAEICRDRSRARQPVSRRRSPGGGQGADRRAQDRASICCRSPPIRCTVRRAPARCSCANGSRLARSSRAAVTSTGFARAR